MFISTLGWQLFHAKYLFLLLSSWLVKQFSVIENDLVTQSCDYSLKTTICQNLLFCFVFRKKEVPSNTTLYN